ncbi:NAD(+) diphosphatase [Carboxylicivirga sediminis]|uniref:NAD(+) diphosphatase n=1 Tax=Carboxylicivirga sediminis TaxID=2006564 RepID=A0A941F1L4_9BACT|nr:NAD(+) diphosphatase [Carboxylicivirga sediminis]MBR8534115.1 NAD(+) diphosphatase [Carboxylicivirga sediminis]
MINEIHPHKLDLLYDSSKTVDDKAYILIYSERSILLKGNDSLANIPQWEDLSMHLNQKNLIYLFCLNGTNCFLHKQAISALPNGQHYHSIDIFRTMPQELGWITILGFQIYNWYLSNKYCGRCGAATEPGLKERAIICKACDTTAYPTISPAIIVAITCKDKILLARGNHFPPGRYSLVAGYVDVGETLEETVIREVKEEVGLDVNNIRYYKNHPWPLSGSLMVGFIAEADDQQAIEIDHHEIAEAAWFSRDNIPDHYSANISISGEMIDKFRKGEL